MNGLLLLCAHTHCTHTTHRNFARPWEFLTGAASISHLCWFSSFSRSSNRAYTTTATTSDLFELNGKPYAQPYRICTVKLWCWLLHNSKRDLFCPNRMRDTRILVVLLCRGFANNGLKMINFTLFTMAFSTFFVCLFVLFRCQFRCNNKLTKLIYWILAEIVWGSI